MRSPHEVLGISENATGVQIEEAYNRRKLYLNPANFENGSDEQEQVKAYILELDEARGKMLARRATPAPQTAPNTPPARGETPALARGADDFPVVSPTYEARRKILVSAAAAVALAFLVMLCVSLSFAYTSNLKAKTAAMSARINLLETENDRLRDRMESQRGRIDDLERTVGNLNDTTLNHNSRIMALEYQR